MYNWLLDEIIHVKGMCHSNMGGYWELFFLPCDGGYYEQPADEMEWIQKIIRHVNKAIDEKPKEQNK